MRIQSQTKVFSTQYLSENVYGVQVGGYANKKSFSANVQYMSNEIEFKTYGEITNSIITIRTDNPPDLSKGDYLYLTEPTKKGIFTVGTTIYDDFGQGEYKVESIKTAQIGTNAIKNHTIITARKTV